MGLDGEQVGAANPDGSGVFRHGLLQDPAKILTTKSAVAIPRGGALKSGHNSNILPELWI
jgi:hypothetical protein